MSGPRRLAVPRRVAVSAGEDGRPLEVGGQVVDAVREGEADLMLGRALAGRPRESFCAVGAVGHDFYDGERDGPRGFPRFTDPRLRAEDGYADYLRMATERSLERCGIDSFDLLL